MARHGINQTKLAPLIPFSQQALSRRLNGEVAFNIDELARIAEILEVSISVLIDGDRASA